MTADTERPGRASTRLGRAAIASCVLTVVLMSVTHPIVGTPYSNWDEVVHVDYAAQLWHGQLPTFEEGPAAVRPDGARIPPVQWAAHHPPFFYLLLAPVVGPLVDAGHLVGAAYAGRVFNVLLAACTVALVPWAARPFARSARTPLVTAFVVACTARLPQTSGGGAFNDVLAVLLLVVVVGLTGRALRRGLDGRLVAAICFAAAACAMTRASAAVVAACCGLAAVGAGVWHARRQGRRPVAAIALLTLGPAAVLATSGWFYVRNLRLTGRLAGGDPTWAVENAASLRNTNREFRTVLEVAADPDTWGGLLSVFAWGGVIPRWGALLVLLVPVAAAVPRASRMLALPAGLIVVTIGMQLLYATEAGGLSPRYLLPVALPVGLLVATGLTGYRWYPWVLLTWTAVIVTDFGSSVALRLAPESQTGPLHALTVPAVVTACTAVVVCLVAAVLVARATRRTLPDDDDSERRAGRAADVVSPPALGSTL